MKFVLFWEFDAKDLAKVEEKQRQLQEERKKNPNKFPKSLSLSFYYVGQTKGFALYEADSPDQLTNFPLHYMPEGRAEFIPIQEMSAVTELYGKMKK